jgi:glycolate oxidase FAD binding subunit
MGAYDDLAAVCPQLREATDDDRVDGVQPTLVATPGSTDETSALMRAAAGHDLTVVARGNGTKLSWGLPPRHVDLVIETTGMDRVIEHAAGDLVAVAEAGVPLAELQRQLGSAGQQLALDETVPGSTIGGTIATSPSGPHRMATGTVRDLLIGVTIVRADGVVAKSGGKVVKNVAGYDLGKLMTGSFGTLGVITQAAFRLHPLLPATRWVRATADSESAAGALVESVLHSQTVPAALEVDWPVEGAGSVAVSVEGTEGGVESRWHAVAELLGPTAEVHDQAPGWTASYPWASGGTSLKLTCQLSAVPEVLTVARSCGVAVRGSAGVGVLYGGLPADTDPETARRVVDRLRETCGNRGGSVVVVDAPAEVKTAVDVWGPVHGLDLMRRVKDQFDPDHRLAPGRFVGGI